MTPKAGLIPRHLSRCLQAFLCSDRVSPRSFQEPTCPSLASRAHPSYAPHPIFTRCPCCPRAQRRSGHTIGWQASAVVPGSSGHRCSPGHLSFHATDRAKNNVLRSLFSLVVITETALWIKATDSIYPELRGAQFPFCFAVFHHPFHCPQLFSNSL